MTRLSSFWWASSPPRTPSRADSTPSRAPSRVSKLTGQRPTRASTSSSVATGGGRVIDVSSFMYSCTEMIPCRLASAGITVFEGLLSGSGMENGEAIVREEVDGRVEDVDDWLIAADVDGMFHLGSAITRGSSCCHPPLGSFGFPFWACFRGWGCRLSPLNAPRTPPLPPLPTGGICCCCDCPWGRTRTG